jgi:hypothetical protein
MDMIDSVALKVSLLILISNVGDTGAATCCYTIWSGTNCASYNPDDYDIKLHFVSDASCANFFVLDTCVADNTTGIIWLSDEIQWCVGIDGHIWKNSCYDKFTFRRWTDDQTYQIEQANARNYKCWILIENELKVSSDPANCGAFRLVLSSKSSSDYTSTRRAPQLHRCRLTVPLVSQQHLWSAAPASIAFSA